MTSVDRFHHQQGPLATIIAKDFISFSLLAFTTTVFINIHVLHGYCAEQTWVFLGDRLWIVQSDIKLKAERRTVRALGFCFSRSMPIE